MNGLITALILWWLLTTLIGVWVAERFDRWITHAHGDERQDATRRVVPTAFLVVWGVAGTEILRLVRWLPVIWAASGALGLTGWLNVLLFVGVWVLDVLTAYSATGGPMVRGDLRRETRAWAEVDALATARAEQRAQEWRDANDA